MMIRKKITTKIFRNNSIIIILFFLFNFSNLFAQQDSILELGVEINGVVWASRNLDKPKTFCENVEDYGMYYQWNRTVGWTVTNPMTGSNGEKNWDGTMPTGEIWEESNNVCPEDWRLPTREELEALSKLPNKWEEQNGVWGRSFYSEDKFIFLPASGYRFNGTGNPYAIGQYGNYWTANIANKYNMAYSLGFDKNIISINEGIRTACISVRCVKK